MTVRHYIPIPGPGASLSARLCALCRAFPTLSQYVTLRQVWSHTYPIGNGLKFDSVEGFPRFQENDRFAHVTKLLTLYLTDLACWAEPIRPIRLNAASGLPLVLEQDDMGHDDG